MDADGLTLACATAVEERAARASGAQTARIGVGGHNGFPGGRLVSFGLAGALREGLACGDVFDATRVVDSGGRTLWEGGPLGVPGARTGTILGAERIVDDPAERRALHEATGADIVDLESGPLARTGRLAGCLRVVADTPARRLGGMARAVTAEGRTSWPGLARALAGHPIDFARAAGDGARALRALGRAGEGLTA